MKAVILAGGLGTRISEESHLRPKPMIEIGSHPILWHIMKHFSHFGVKDFIICVGYKGFMIKEYFANYALHNSDATFFLRSGKTETVKEYSEDWNVTVVDTGVDSLTGARIKAVEKYLGGETFFMTYGDGLADVDLKALLLQHKAMGRLATVTAVRQPSRYGALDFSGSEVVRFAEKPLQIQSWINGGFFVLEPGVFDYIGDRNIAWESEPMSSLVLDSQLSAYKHDGFWQSMDTLREKLELEKLWISKSAPWKTWN
jgi:glucose-1-phosphate cytidylyltransferase